MTRWLPRFNATGGSLSDGRGADAEGFVLTFEWLGLIFELCFYHRGSGL